MPSNIAGEYILVTSAGSAAECHHYHGWHVATFLLTILNLNFEIMNMNRISNDFIMTF